MNAPEQPLIQSPASLARGGPVVVFVHPDQPAATGIDWLDAAVNRLRDDGLGNASHPTPVCVQHQDAASTTLVVVNRIPNDAQALRERAAQAIALLREQRQSRCAVVLSGLDGFDAQVITEGVLSANHAFVSAGPARDSRNYLQAIAWVAHDPDGRLASALRCAWLTSLAALTARDLVTEPANILTPPAFVERCRALASDAGFTLQVMDGKAIEAAGMGGLAAVAAGSRHDPYLVRMEWRPEDAPADARPIVLVGKTVTFDSGGLSIKKAQDMDFMKADMGGGAAVLGVMHMIAQLRPAFPATAIFAVVENMPGSHAMRPSDVIRMGNGATVEIINTDAEGRLILADALHHASGLAPRVIIDIATLTGATLGTFGPIGTPVFANNDQWFESLQAADRIAGDRVWRMPLWPEYRRFIESPVADSRNYATTGQNGSTPVAAAFLSQFIDDHPWLHLDVYNTCWNHRDTALMPQGPTGSGSRVLAQLILNLAQGGQASAPGKSLET